MFNKGGAYEQFMGRWSRLLAPRLLELAGLKEGDAVLDVGCGTGALSIAALHATETAHVTGIDPSAEFIRHATEQHGASRVRFEVGDAERLAFEDGSFDKTLSMLVLNFVAGRDRALAEMKRVTRPGGVVAAAVWDYADGMQMLRIFWDEVVALAPGDAARDEGSMPWCKSGELASAFERSGLLGVEQASLTVTLHFDSFEDYWSPFCLGHGPAGAYVAALSQADRDTLMQRLRARLVGAGADRGFDMTARAWAAKGRVA